MVGTSIPSLCFPPQPSPNPSLSLSLSLNQTSLLSLVQITGGNFLVLYTVFRGHILSMIPPPGIHKISLYLWQSPPGVAYFQDWPTPMVLPNVKHQQNFILFFQFFP